MAPTATVQQWLEQNERYIRTHEPKPFITEFSVEMAPRVLIFVCCDARVDPETILGLKPGEAIVVRNAGGYVPLQLNDLLLLDSLRGFKEILVIQHTDCGVTYTTDETIKQYVLDTAPDRSDDIETLQFGTFRNDLASTESRAREMVQFIKTHPLVRKELAQNTVGAVYDIKTGKVTRVD